MSNTVENFTFNTSSIRVVTIGGQPWFVGSDVRDVLGIQKGGTAFASLGSDEKQIIRKCGQTPLKGHGWLLLSESGLYKLIMRSDKPEAKAFQDWELKWFSQRYARMGARVS